MNIDSSPEDTPHLQQSGWPCRASYRHQEWGASLFTLQRTLQSSISGVSMGFQIADKLLLHRISCLWQGLAVNAVQSQAWHLLSRYVCLVVWTIPFLSRKKGQGSSEGTGASPTPSPNRDRLLVWYSRELDFVSDSI